MGSSSSVARRMPTRDGVVSVHNRSTYGITKRGAVWWIDFVSPNGERIRESAETGDRRQPQEVHDQLSSTPRRLRPQRGTSWSHPRHDRRISTAHHLQLSEEQRLRHEANADTRIFNRKSAIQRPINQSFVAIAQRQTSLSLARPISARHILGTPAHSCRRSDECRRLMHKPVSHAVRTGTTQDHFRQTTKGSRLTPKLHILNCMKYVFHV